MATVQISQQLIHDTRTRIAEMQNTSLKNYNETDKPKIQAADKMLAAEIETYMWAPNKELRDKIPTRWTTLLVNLRIPVRDINRALGRGLDTPCHIPGNITAPPNTNSYGVNIPEGTLSQECIDKVVEVEKGRKKIEEDFNQLSEKVLTFLREQPSLNKALAAYPNLKFYVPESYLNRVAEKREKAKREASSIVLDDAELAVVGVTHRLTASA